MCTRFIAPDNQLAATKFLRWPVRWRSDGGRHCLNMCKLDIDKGHGGPDGNSGRGDEGSEWIRAAVYGG